MQIKELSNHGELIWWVFQFKPEATGNVFWNKELAEKYLNHFKGKDVSREQSKSFLNI